jgi:hypothetical protein
MERGGTCQSSWDTMLNSSAIRASRNAGQTRHDFVRNTEISECGERSHPFAGKVRSSETDDRAEHSKP